MLMKKLKMRTSLIVLTLSLLSYNHVNAQNTHKGGGRAYVDAIDDGRVLTATDIRFFNSITGGGNDSRTTVVFGKKFTAGQHLTSNEAAALNLAKSEYRKKHKLEKAADGKAYNTHIYESCSWYVYNGDGEYYVWYCD
jgi:hypothetical protein